MPPRGYENDFFVGSGSGASLADARGAAIASAVARFAESGRLTVRLTRTDSTTATETVRTSQARELARVDKTVQEIILTGTSPTVRGLRLHEEYSTERDGRYEDWVLMRVPKDGGRIEVPTRSSFVLKSALLPGWGQVAMGQERKGVLLALSAAVAVPTAIALSSIRQENLSRARNTQIAQSRDYYTSQANRQGTLMSVTIAAAATLWGYGIVDAASSPSRLYVRNQGPTTNVGFRLPTAFGN